MVFDKDNTLTKPYVKAYHSPKLEEAILSRCSEVFGLDQIAILSNSAGSRDDKNHKEAKSVEQSLGLKVIRHELKKPAVCDDILKHFEAQEA